MTKIDLLDTLFSEGNMEEEEKKRVATAMYNTEKRYEK
jgi:hypothetical protein